MLEMASASWKVFRRVACCLTTLLRQDLEERVWLASLPLMRVGLVVPSFGTQSVLLILADGKWHEDADGVPFSSKILCSIVKSVWAEPSLAITAYQLVWTCLVVRALPPLLSRDSVCVILDVC